ncbi:MAG: 50S ribosomal protein L13 [Candidatus Wildermuthbacteria bacterium RIFCSPLOWO2_02_FULL_47_9c]|uniref:Large ribosomal subunit protein uL13 n=2 Tax=Parcubacteria group TaxID=1794811 RepID=A0A837ILT8_9BACT|nr:MAG: 50S ribosomal protein L13 [Candidatus Yanofskybacteria bacterium GW2011_GWC1_48_11]KKW04598.1 MAG: 50S ribosomal protein L13 [Parcubacteria group bacterium GW2011_GWB1_49_12]KKW09144.1 MAG: 50S ribosomal protein L13 [Parcubacteria group bacterium GW2011_GWA1_49_26]KKW13520.1 MAG: 50S ribosomal protein L13 [Parcubacteria group bacterium GW2011_GWA2_50_10]OHA61401.1 MAG: 50S ribosomal protein L13 [Candidatus Wildermuthbacteria bacterium GWA1_49_26]OHA66256.1 MAG: 50S ribosomal protein L1
MKTIERETHTIDAKDKRFGRLASRIALLLRGKHKPEFALHKDVGDFVVVKNAEQMQFSGRKFAQKVYYRHSGYLGNLRQVQLQKLFAARPGEVLRKAVWGMLPKNKLRPKQIRRLSVE